MTETDEASARWWKVFNPAHYTILAGIVGVGLWVNNGINRASWEIGQLKDQIAALGMANTGFRSDLRDITTTLNTTGADIRVLKVQVEQIQRSTDLTMLEPDIDGRRP